MQYSLRDLNAMDVADFTAVLGDVFEHSPWVAAQAAQYRPFSSLNVLHAAMVAAVRTAGPEQQLALLHAHPELASLDDLSPASQHEQQGAGLDQISPAERARFATANTAYRARFGFPFIIAVRNQPGRDAILAAIRARLAHKPEQEREVALDQVAEIARFRLEDRIIEDAAGWITTHVLDTVYGQPAAGLGIELFELRGDRFRLLAQGETDADGRLLCNLSSGMGEGLYELVFHVAAWRRARGEADGFYPTIPVRFQITGQDVGVHVPLILSPYGYSTYRGT